MSLAFHLMCVLNTGQKRWMGNEGLNIILAFDAFPFILIVVVSIVEICAFLTVEDFLWVKLVIAVLA
jgi:hypothetical protein